MGNRDPYSDNTQLLFFGRSTYDSLELKALNV